MNMEIKARLFSIEHDGQSIVRVRQIDNGDFDEALSIIGDILSCFRMSKPGSTWGCDGIGYVIEKQHGKAFQNKSGVGKRKFAQGLDTLRTGVPDPYVGS